MCLYGNVRFLYDFHTAWYGSFTDVVRSMCGVYTAYTNYTRSIYGFVRICTGLYGFIRVCTGLYGCDTVYVRFSYG